MFRLSLLGGLALEGPEGPVEGRVSQRLPLALLALLATPEVRLVSRDKLVASLWPDTAADRARPRLSTALHAVREGLGSEAVVSVGDELRLDPARVTADVWVFSAALEAGDLERAVALYGGAMGCVWTPR